MSIYRVEQCPYTELNNVHIQSWTMSIYRVEQYPYTQLNNVHIQSWIMSIYRVEQCPFNFHIWISSSYLNWSLVSIYGANWRKHGQETLVRQMITGIVLSLISHMPFSDWKKLGRNRLVLSSRLHQSALSWSHLYITIHEFIENMYFYITYITVTTNSTST